MAISCGCNCAAEGNLPAHSAATVNEAAGIIGRDGVERSVGFAPASHRAINFELRDDSADRGWALRLWPLGPTMATDVLCYVLPREGRGALLWGSHSEAYT